MITLENYEKIEKSFLTISHQVDIKATAANVHKLKTQWAILHSSIWGIRNTSDKAHYLAVANRAKLALEGFGIRIIL